MMTPPTAHAQAGMGYVTGGPALVTGLGNHDFAWQVGTGAEWGAGVVGVGGGFDYIYFTEVNKTFDGGRGSSTSPAGGLPAFTVNASYYPTRAEGDRRILPFVIYGATFPVAKEAPLLPFLAGGVDWWKTRKAGLRFEVQYQFVLLAFRCGVVFR